MLPACGIWQRAWILGDEHGPFDIIILCVAFAFIALATSTMGVVGLMVASAICIVTWAALHLLRQWRP